MGIMKVADILRKLKKTSLMNVSVNREGEKLKYFMQSYKLTQFVAADTIKSMADAADMRHCLRILVFNGGAGVYLPTKQTLFF